MNFALKVLLHFIHLIYYDVENEEIIEFSFLVLRKHQYFISNPNEHHSIIYYLERVSWLPHVDCSVLLCQSCAHCESLSPYSCSRGAKHQAENSPQGRQTSARRQREAVVKTQSLTNTTEKHRRVCDAQLWHRLKDVSKSTLCTLTQNVRTL